MVDSGTDTTLTCTSTSSGTIRAVSWKKGSFNVTYNDADAILLYNTIIQGVIWDPLVDQNHYEFDHTLSGVPLTIKSVTLHDEAQYWCYLNIGSGIGSQFGTAVMRVRGEFEIIINFVTYAFCSDELLTASQFNSIIYLSIKTNKNYCTIISNLYCIVIV